MSKNLNNTGKKPVITGMKNYKTIFWKVVVGFGIAACLLATTYWIAFDNLRELKKNINSLAELNPKNIYRKNISKKVDDIDFYVRKYTMNKNDSLPALFDRSVYEVGVYMDELDSIAADNEEYGQMLRKLGFYINLKIQLGRQRLSLSEGYNSNVELSGIMTQIADYETEIRTQKEEKAQTENPPLSQQPADGVKEEPKKKENFFSRMFSRNKNKKRPKTTSPEPLTVAPDPFLDAPDPALKEIDTSTANNVVSSDKVKDILEDAQLKENAKTSRYYLEALTLMEKDDKVMDSIRSISATMEKMEMAESKATINRLTDDTTNRTSEILTNLIVSGVAALLVFVIVVYREVRHNNKLRKELIKEKKSTEKLAKAKEEFLANMSHEIRTPMNVIVGFSEQLLKTGLESDQQKLLLNIKRSSSHLITIINEILDYSKMESGIIMLEKITFDVEEVLNDVYVSFKNTADKKNIQLSYTMEENISKWVVGDSVRLKQILLNLVGNAVKFTEKGAVTLSCNISSADAHSQTLLFEVTDTGIGIPEDAQGTVFEQFTQADSSVTRKYGGTGLGLTISKKLVEALQGEIGVKSEPGKGSTFYFTIPYKLASAEEHAAYGNGSQDGSVKDALTGKKVLVADDDEMNKLLVQHILENYNMDVDTAVDGAEAEEKLLKNQYDIVLMDLHMPKMGGLDVVMSIRKKNITVPMIAVTGNVMKGEKDKCLNAGMNAYISKPYNEAELLQKMTELLPTV